MATDADVTPLRPSNGGQPGKSGPPGSQNARKTGHRRVEMELKELRHRDISGRTWLGRTMRDWRGDLVSDLGGEAGLSTQERALVDVATRTKVSMLDQSAERIRAPRHRTMGRARKDTHASLEYL